MSDVLNMQAEILQAGQSGPYTPREYKYLLTFTRPSGEPWTPQRGNVERFVSALRGQLVYAKRDEDRQWFHEYFEEIVETEPGVWFVHTYREYLD